MKKRVKPLLSEPDEKFPDENWLFLFDEYSKEIVDRGWVSEFIFYELSRELNPERPGAWDARAYLEEVSEGWFPEAPFLKLDPEDQEELVGKMRQPGSFFDMHFRLMQSGAIFQVEIERPLTDEAAELLEVEAMRAARTESAKWNGLHSENFLPLTNPGEKAATIEKNRLIAEGADIFEPGQFRVTLHLDLGECDKAIVDEFEALLKRIRTTTPLKERDRRGKTKSAIFDFRKIAAFRLKRKYGSFASLTTVLEKENLPELPISSEGGWNKAVKGGRQMVNEFKQRFEGLEEVSSSSDEDQIIDQG